MTPELSEFSYGFALTHELVGRTGPLRAAPVFPSLIEEGRAGGGYDVLLDRPGVPLYLQFKRADCMVRGTAAEVRDGHIPNVPFYRLRITDRNRSAQHSLLLELDDGLNEVYYAAPRFHTIRELNECWKEGTVEARSFFIRPQTIGILDDGPHHVAYDEHQHYVCSEPRPVRGVIGRELDDILLQRVENETRDLSSGPLQEALERAESAVERAARSHISAPSSDDLEIAPDGIIRPDTFVSDTPGSEPNRVRSPRTPRRPEEEQLRKLSDLAVRTFGSQLFIIQQA